MDESIIKRMLFKRATVFVVLCVVSWLVLIFTGIGVYESIWNVPSMRVEITGLTGERDAWQARAKELEKYIKTREGQYRVATKFDQLFMLIANPNQVMDFERLEQYIKNKKAFFRKYESKKAD